MKYYKIIVKFRIAYRKLQYVKSKLTVWALQEWAKSWCKENGIPEDLFSEFEYLANAYAEEDFYQACIERNLKR